MARIRTIKPETWVSEQVASVCRDARLLFIGLWNFCDDRGVHPASPRTLKAEVFPMDDDVKTADVQGWVGDLIRVGLIAEFEADGNRYWHVTGWAKHQRIDKPTNKHPAPPAADLPSPRRVIGEPSPRNPGVIDAQSVINQQPLAPGVEGSGVEAKGVDAGSPKARARTVGKKTGMRSDFGISDRVKAWAAQKGFDRLDEHLEAFKSKVAALGYTYVDWDEAFMGAIRDDWARLRGAGTGYRGGAPPARTVLHADEQFN